MRAVVLGATGLAGTAIVRELGRRGVDVVPASRASGVNIVTREGLPEAVDGAEVVIDAANANRPKESRQLLIGGTANALAAVEQAGVPHYVLVSIIGIEEFPFKYYSLKVEQEGLVRSAAVQSSIVRATQFFEFLDPMLKYTARKRILPFPDACVQPVAADEVAAVVADAASDGTDRALAGPEVLTIRQMAAIRDALKPVVRRLPIAPWLPKRRKQLLADGVLTDPSTQRGSTTYEQWLSGRGGAS